MSIANEIQRLQRAKADIAEAIVAKGGEVSGTLDNYASAIEALPSGGGGSAAVLEGDITLASTQNFILVTHNLGKVAIFATIMITDEHEDETYVPYSASVYDNEFGGFGVGEGFNNYITVSKYGQALPVKNGDIYAPQNTETFVRFYSGAPGRRFLAGNYHYKIYYAL